jgi:formyl-CoA transferase
MLNNADYKDAKSRSANRKVLNEEIGTYTQHKSSAEWIDIMNKAGVPAGPIYSIDQVFADPQVQHLGIAQSVKKKDKSTLNVVGQPFVMSRTKSKIAAPPPELGQHTNEVLKEFGFNPKEIAALRKANAL